MAYCSAIRQRLGGLDDAGALKRFWTRNRDTIADLCKQLPDLKVDKGEHYGEILGALYEARLRELTAPKTAPAANPGGENARRGSADPLKPGGTNADARQARGANAGHNESVIGSIKKGPRRARDKAHLEFVAAKNCLVCGRFPSQAHHVLCAQSRALGRKVSDEWVVPLCAIHHRALHAFGDEERWWQQQDLDPITEAQGLWQMSDQFRRVG